LPDASTVAVVASLLLHVPPVVVVDNAVVEPAQTVAVPVIDATPVLTVTVRMLWHPAVRV
jgi:hypothetical protein